MSRNINQQESYRIAAEKVRQKREKEAREDREFYERTTSGFQWIIFKVIVVFSALMLLISTFEFFFDGPTKKLSENSWEINREWEYSWHKVLDVEGYMFTPTIADWGNRVENTLEITYSPVFRTGKKLSYDMKTDESGIKRHVEIRQRSIFTWFPAFQLFLLIPIFTFIFKRQSAFFNFARITSLAVVFPGTLMVIYFAMF